MRRFDQGVALVSAAAAIALAVLPFWQSRVHSGATGIAQASRARMVRTRVKALAAVASLFSQLIVTAELSEHLYPSPDLGREPKIT